MHNGVYVDHTGPLTWLQRAWAGVLAVWPAALTAESVVSPDRDLDAAADRHETLRLGWGQVFDRPCLTAHRVARVLVARGWDGSSLTRCSSTCASPSRPT